MIRRILTSTVATVAIIAMAAGPAQAMDGQAFTIHFHTDASLTHVVGFARAACNPDPVAIMQWGTSTPYQQITYVGECIDGELYYY